MLIKHGHWSLSSYFQNHHISTPQPMRPKPPAPLEVKSEGKGKAGWTRPADNPAEYQRMKNLYYEQASLPATRTISSFEVSLLDFFIVTFVIPITRNINFFKEDKVTEVVEGKAWVVTGLLSPEVALLYLSCCHLCHLCHWPSSL